MATLFDRAASVLSRRAVFLACLCSCLAADLVLARMLMPMSDSLQSYNEMLAIRGGNLLLRHWVLATDNFLFTDLPPFVLGSFVLGTSLQLIYLVPFLVFAALIGACLLIVRATAPTRGGRYAGAYLVLLLLGLPYGLAYNFFFWSDFHVATVALCLYAVLLAAPVLSRRRFNRLLLAPYALLVFAAAFSDPLADILFCGPVLLLVILRAWRAGALTLDDALLAGATILGVGCAIALSHAVITLGGYQTASSVSFTFVRDAAAMWQNLHAVLGGIKLLFTTKAKRIADLPLYWLIAATRLATEIGVAALCAAVVWRAPRVAAGGLAQLLVLGAACLTGIAAVSVTFAAAVSNGLDFPGAAVRFVLPVFVFLCLAAAIQAGDAFAGANPGTKRVLLGIGAGFAAIYGIGAAATVRADLAVPTGIARGQQRVLADWLLAQGLHYGVGDYWDTQMVNALSRGRLVLDPAAQAHGRVALYPWLTDTSRFGYNIPPQFVVIRPGGLFHIDLAGVEATYGKPASVTKVAGFYFVARMPPH